MNTESLSISLILLTVLWFSIYISCTYFVRFVSVSFLWCLCKWFFTSNSTCSLLVHKEVMNFILTLNPATFLYNQLLAPGFFFWFPQIFYKQPCHMQEASFTLSLPIRIRISFSCLIHYLGFPVQWWKGMVRGDILALFMILVGKLVSH